MQRARSIQVLFSTGGMVLMTGCGGGGSSSVQPPTDVELAQRISAATTTAQTHSACSSAQPFYWEIGSNAQTLAAGTVGGSMPQADSVLPIASASKWIYSTYYVQRSAGALTNDDVSFFTFRSGYTNFLTCGSAATVGDCLTVGDNGVQDPATIGKFSYGGGHMQVHAANHGLAAMDGDQLAAEMRRQIGTEIAINYGEPQLAGGGRSSAAEYAKMLRKILRGDLLMRDALGTHAVCASPNVCPTAALGSPAPPSESWRYSIGHWVEDASNDSDGAFSSPGAFGFYPWIDKSKTWYGIVSRLSATGALESVYCGRMIRKAWVTGSAQ